MSNALGVIPGYVRSAADLEVLLAAVRTLRETEPELDLIVVDDGSPEPTLVETLREATSRFDFELHVKDENSGFSKTVNVGLRRALEQGQDAVLVNADVEFFEPGWLGRMQAQQREDGEGLADVVGALLLYPNGLIQHAGIYFSLLTRTFGHIYQYGPGDLPEASVARTCPVTGALQFIRHDCLERIGLYDEEFFMGWEDVDYCLRVFGAGGSCVYQPRVRAFHHEQMFRGRPSEKVADWGRKSFIRIMSKYAKTNFIQWVPQF